ncbi:hypothetical protein L218DRAFT_959871 [Marasmius fiardii PR-910]|nr:hypothetical protein L218DRAFT_959871 [Marasmius fiardii PR-910]
MISLETLTPFQDKTIELEQFQLIPLSSPRISMFVPNFEWGFGLEYGTFPFTGELNTISVSKDIRRYLEERALVLLPNTDVLEKAYDMLDYNDIPSREPSERKRFEEFGTGPWEYAILPGCWNRDPMYTKPLPPLFHCSTDGTVIPVHFDDYDTLPCFTSAIHPLAVILCHRFMLPDNHPSSKIQEKLIAPVKKVCHTWPQWLHSRFVPLPDHKFKNPVDNLKARKIACRWSICFREEQSTSDGSTSDLEDTSTNASDEDVQDVETRIVEYKEICRTTNERISKWRGYLEGVPLFCEDVSRDDMLDQYAQEPAEDAEKVMLRHLREEQRKREALAAGIQQDLASNKRCRRG